eukprot:COSAG05_NODE_2299_length_3258_cov_2.988382_5_plen_46_part_00
MVPEFRPLEAAELMRRWLAKEPLQQYNEIDLHHSMHQQLGILVPS